MPARSATDVNFPSVRARPRVKQPPQLALSKYDGIYEGEEGGVNSGARVIAEELAANRYTAAAD